MSKEDVFNETMFVDGDMDDENEQINKYLLFRLGEEIYGISIKFVTSIIEIQKITEVPDMPEYVKGVVNLRGKVIPVMDLRLRFKMPERPYDDRTCIIIVEVQGKSLAFIVDTVAEVHDIHEDNIEPPPQFKKNTEMKNYISGLAKIGEEVKILIDVEKVLKQGDMELLEENIE